MRKRLLKMTLALLASLFLGSALMAQGTYGGTQMFNMNVADSSKWVFTVDPTAGSTHTGTYPVVKDGYTISVDGIGTTLTGRAKTFTTVNNAATSPVTSIAYTKAVKCWGVTFSDFSSLGQISLAVQNGSSGTAGLFKTQTSVDGGTTWVTVDSITLAGNALTIIRPSNVITKSGVKMRFVFPWQCWFFGVQAYNNVNEASASNGPAFISASPVAGSSLPADGSIALTFDELLKAGVGNISLGNATISSVKYLGNVALITYTGYSNSTNPLAIDAAAITDNTGTALTAPVSINYVIDVTPPSLSSTSIASGSIIHINDLGQDARKIKLTFSEPIKIATGTISFNGATVTTSVSGSVLTISYSGLQYNATNTLTVPASFITDLTGNALTSDIVLTYLTGARDNTSPILKAQSVADAATAQPIGGSLYFTFNEIVLPSTTIKATVNGTPVYLSNSDSIIGLNYTNLPYSSTITVNLPAGCVTDTCGNAYAGTSFTFTTAAKVNQAFTYVVAKDGTGDFKTLTEAVAAASGTTRTLIYIKPGVYTEKLFVNKANVSFIGQHPDSVIIAWGECSSTSTLQSGTGITSQGTDASYTMLIGADNFYGENFTVKNTYDYNAGTEANKQAVALEHINSDKAVLKNVKMFSYQDTYYPKSANKRQYLYNCYIQGGTDFIFGSGTCYIDSSTIKCVTGGQYIVAASGTSKEFGTVLNKCTASYADASFNMGSLRQFYLGRPWQNPSKTTYINCAFESTLLQAAGWAEWSGTTNHLSAVYSEYNSTDLALSPLSIASRVAWSSQLNATQVSRYNPDNAFNYGVSGTWNAKPYIIAPATPSIASMSLNGVLSWNDVDFAVGYLVYRNDTLVASVTSPTYTATNVNLTDVYKVAAYNEYGAASARSQGVVSSIKNPVAAQVDVLQYTVVDKEIVLKNPDYYATVEIVNAAGQRLLSKDITSAYVYVGNFPKGTYYVRACTKLNECRVESFVKK